MVNLAILEMVKVNNLSNSLPKSLSKSQHYILRISGVRENKQGESFFISNAWKWVYGEGRSRASASTTRIASLPYSFYNEYI